MKLSFIGLNTIYGVEGEDATPYMTRLWIGRLRLHIFHRGDADPDHHDHPWAFWTFPLTSYVEEVVDADIAALARSGGYSPKVMPDAPFVFRRVVPAFRLSYRPAIFCHRVLGRYSGFWFTRSGLFLRDGDPRFDDRIIPLTDDRRIVTIVWRGRTGRRWGFLKHRDGRFCWVHWKEYVFRGGKTAPCAEQEERS